MPPLIGITSRDTHVKDINLAKDDWLPLACGQYIRYIQAVVQAGGLPLIIPYVNDASVLKQLYDRCSGILVCGGWDIDPKNYHSDMSPLVKCGAEWCDKQELQLLKWSLADDKPVLGICRGMQMLNIVQGGNLYTDIATDLPQASDHEISVKHETFTYLAHTLTVKSGSKLAKILESEEIKTNSLHHQAIKQIGENLIAVAHSEDGVIEAIEMPGKQFVVGVQSHPEALVSGTEPNWLKLFQALVQSAV